MTYVDKVLEGTPYFEWSVGNWYLVEEDELPELAKETPEISGENLMDKIDLDKLEGKRIKITIEVIV